jgi:hypothetical protein
MKAPKTLLEAVAYFKDQDRCIAYLAGKRWPDGVVRCPGAEAKASDTSKIRSGGSVAQDIRNASFPSRSERSSKIHLLV